MDSVNTTTPLLLTQFLETSATTAPRVLEDPDGGMSGWPRAAEPESSIITALR